MYFNCKWNQVGPRSKAPLLISSLLRGCQGGRSLKDGRSLKGGRSLKASHFPFPLSRPPLFTPLGIPLFSILERLAQREEQVGFPPCVNIFRSCCLINSTLWCDCVNLFRSCCLKRWFWIYFTLWCDCVNFFWSLTPLFCKRWNGFFLHRAFSSNQGLPALNTPGGETICRFCFVRKLLNLLVCVCVIVLYQPPSYSNAIYSAI